MSDENDLDLFDENDGDDKDASGSADDEKPDAPQGDDKDASGSKDSEKRINDLMSKWQGAEARAKKAETALAGKSGGTSGETKVSPELQAWMELARESQRGQLFAGDPRFAKYGLDVTSVEGDTPELMIASTTRLKKLVDTLESKMRNSILQEHGIVPEVSGAGGAGARVDYANMSSEEFEKHVKRNRGL